MSANTEMEKTDNADDNVVEKVNSAVIAVEENMHNVQTTPVDNCEGVIVQLRSSLEIDNAAFFAFVDFAECVAEFVTSVVRSYHNLLALARCIHDAEEELMQHEICSSNKKMEHKYKVKHLSSDKEDQALLVQDMLTLFHHILSPYDAVYHHPCWLFVNEEVQMTLADRINYFQEWWRCRNNFSGRSEINQKRIVEQTKLNLTEQERNDSEMEARKLLTSHITSKESIMPTEFIIVMWHELYNTLGASWRQRKRLFHNLQWAFQYHARYYTFANVHYYSGRTSRTYKYNENKKFDYNEKYKNEYDEDDVIAFGPLTPTSIGISTSSRCVIRCPLNSFWRTLAIVPIVNKNRNINSCIEERYTYLFDESAEDVALCHAIPYLSPQCYYNYVISHNKNINTMNDNSHDTNIQEEEQKEEYEKTIRIAHSYSDDVWNVSILILEIALCGFDVHCLMPREQTSHKEKTPHCSVYTEIIHFLISEHHMLPQAAYNFVYAALHHFERLILSEEELEENLQEEQQRKQEYREGMELSPEHLAQQWLLYLRKAYGNEFVNLFFAKEVVSRALRWRRQDRWNAFIETFGPKRKKEKEEKQSIDNNDDSENETNEEINVSGKVSVKCNKISLLTAVHTHPNYYQNEHKAALIALPSVKELIHSKTHEIVDNKSIMPLWSHFNLSWWDECQSWIKNVVNQSMAELDVRACPSTYRRITFDSYLHLITRYVASLFVTNLENYTNKLPFCIAMHPFLRELRRLQQLRLLHLATQQTFMFRNQKENCKTNFNNPLMNYYDHYLNSQQQQSSSIFLSSSFIYQFTNRANDELHRRHLYKQMWLDENFLEWEENMCYDVDDMNIDLDKYLSDLQITETEFQSDSSESEEQCKIEKPCELEKTNELHKNSEENDVSTWEDIELSHIAELRSVLLEQMASWQDGINNNMKETIILNINDNIDDNVNKSSHMVNDFLVQKYWEWYFVNGTSNKSNNVNNEEEEWSNERWAHSPIPPTLRSACWFALLQTHSCSLCTTTTTKMSQIESEQHSMKNKTNFESDESELQEDDNCFFMMKQCPWDVHSCVSSFERQLSVDLPRCHQECSLLHTPEAHASLRRCIRGWYRLNNEKWSYWQGIDSLAAVLFSITSFDEKTVTWELHEMIQAFVAHDFDHEPNLGHKVIQHKNNKKSKNAMTNKKTLKDMHESLDALTLLLHYVDPELAYHLFYSVKCDVHLFAVGWFVTLFAHHFPLDEVYLIWDVLLAHSFHYSHCLLCIAAAFIVVRRSTLLQGDFVVCLSALNHINKQHNMLGDKFQNKNYNMKNIHVNNTAYIHSVLSVALKMMYAFPSSVIEKSCSAPYYLNSRECVYSCNKNTISDVEYNTDKVKIRTTESADGSGTFTNFNNTTINEKEYNYEYMLELNKAQQMYEVQLIPVSVVINAFRHEPLRWDFMAIDNVYHDRPPHWTDFGVFIVEVDIITNISDSTTTTFTAEKQYSDEVTRESSSEHSVHKLHNKRLVGALHVQLNLRTLTITNEESIHQNEKLEKQEQKRKEEYDEERSYETKEMEKETLRVHEEQKVNLSHIERACLMQDAAVSLSEQLHHPILATIPPLSVYCANNKQKRKDTKNNIANYDAKVIDNLINSPHVVLVHTAANINSNDSTRSVHDLCDHNQRSKSELEQNYLYLQEFAMQLQKYKVPHVSILFGGQSALYDALPHLFVEEEVSSRTHQTLRR